jgi:hypothetical protein
MQKAVRSCGRRWNGTVGRGSAVGLKPNYKLSPVGLKPNYKLSLVAGIAVYCAVSERWKAINDAG